MSLRDELVENERAASDPLVRVIFRAKCWRSLGKNRENVSISRRTLWLLELLPVARARHVAAVEYALDARDADGERRTVVKMVNPNVAL